MTKLLLSILLLFTSNIIAMEEEEHPDEKRNKVPLSTLTKFASDNAVDKQRRSTDALLPTISGDSLNKHLSSSDPLLKTSWSNWLENQDIEKSGFSPRKYFSPNTSPINKKSKQRTKQKKKTKRKKYSQMTAPLLSKK